MLNPSAQAARSCCFEFSYLLYGASEKIRATRQEAMTGIIFISYRREDAANAAGRLYDRLNAHYGADHLFIDVDKIAGGVDFVTELDKTLAETDVLLAVIGANWLAIEDQETGSRRLDSSADYVRIEIEKAIGHELEIIPVLVEGAAMPRPEDLPETLKPLARRNAMRCRAWWPTNPMRFGLGIARNCRPARAAFI
jgi:hypothetical protein